MSFDYNIGLLNIVFRDAIIDTIRDKRIIEKFYALYPKVFFNDEDKTMILEHPLDIQEYLKDLRFFEIQVSKKLQWFEK